LYRLFLDDDDGFLAICQYFGFHLYRERSLHSLPPILTVFCLIMEINRGFILVLFVKQKLVWVRKIIVTTRALAAWFIISLLD
jgi:hypothetical protein